MSQEFVFRLQGEINSRGSAEELVADLSRVEASRSQRSLTDDEADLLVESIFASMQDVTIRTPELAGDLILSHLLPYCIEDKNGTTGRGLVTGARLRERLRAWLDQYPNESMDTQRARVLGLILDRMVGNPSKAICWTLAAIGLRTVKVLEILARTSMAHDDDLGDAALWTIASLGTTAAERTNWSSELERRLKRRRNRFLVGAARELRDANLVPVLAEIILAVIENDEDRLVRTSALRAVASMAAASPNRRTLQDAVWHVIRRAVDEGDEKLKFEILLGSDVIPECDSEDIPSDVFRWISGDIHHRNLWLHRLQDCYRPAQLRGWGSVRDENVVRSLGTEASRNTLSEGRQFTSEMYDKELAWDALWRLGMPDVLQSAADELEHERNPYLRGRLYEQLASLRLDPLPIGTGELIQRSVDVQPSESSGDLIAIIGATQLARSAATPQAFQLLLDAGLRFNGQVLQATADALADVSAALVARGDTAVLDTLLDRASTRTWTSFRLLAAGALLRLGESGLLPASIEPSLYGLVVRQPVQDPLERSILLGALGQISSAPLSPNAIKQFRIWARDDQAWLRWRALETLARRGALVNDAELLHQSLGLNHVHGSWEAEPIEVPGDRAGFILSVLYATSPAEFAPAVATVLATRDWSWAAPLIGGILRTHVDLSVALPNTVIDALAQRAQRVHDIGLVEPDTLEALARLQPLAVAQLVETSSIPDWVPEARSAAADALASAARVDPSSVARARGLLLGLLPDSNYGVRRAVLRALAQVSPATLAATCREWTRASDVALRRRAAEAWGWLETSTPQSAPRSYARLVVDPEPSVRTAVAAALRERLQRRWAKRYMRRVLAVRESNVEVLRIWRYGAALAKVGDDETIRELAAHTRTAQLPRHVWRWLEQVAEGIGERWRKETATWPEPWIGGEGALERGIGWLTTHQGERLRVRYFVWKRPSRSLSEPASWSGYVTLVEPPSTYVSELADGRLELGDGRIGAILLTQWSSDGSGFFTGQGSYPVSAKNYSEAPQ